MERTTIVHERFNVLGGAEKVTIELAKIWPGARVLSALADPELLAPHITPDQMTSSWLQGISRFNQRDDLLLPLIPLALASARLNENDLVIASHYAFANRIRVSDRVKRVSYVHSPARWMWDSKMRDVEYNSKWARRVLGAFAATQRRADRRAAQRMDGLIANSTAVAERIEKYWHRSSEIVHPPVDVRFFAPDPTVERGDFFLVAGRCVPYKRTQVAIRAANATGSRLVIAGTGRSLDDCRSLAGPTVEFVGAVDDFELRRLLQSARALVFPGVEDFGILPVEAQACGTPVIGVDLGGLRDTVVAGTTGELLSYRADVDEQAALLAECMSSFAEFDYEREKIRAHSLSFGSDAFASGVRRAVTAFG